MLSQLSYSPTGRAKLPPRAGAVKTRTGATRGVSALRRAERFWYFGRFAPEWRNRQTQGPQKAPALAAVWVRVPPPAPPPAAERIQPPGGRRTPRAPGALAGASLEEEFPMRRSLVSFAALVALLAPILAASGASAQMREFTGKVDKISKKEMIVDNRMGDKVKFEKLDSTTVEGEKKDWKNVKKNDWVTVQWKMIDKPRKAYKVVVLPPRKEVGEEVE